MDQCCCSHDDAMTGTVSELALRLVVASLSILDVSGCGMVIRWGYRGEYTKLLSYQQNQLDIVPIFITRYLLFGNYYLMVLYFIKLTYRIIN